MKCVTDLRIGNRRGYRSEAEEIGLPVSKKGIVLPCGSSVRVTFDGDKNE
jgi:hypothetical protein